MGRPSKLTPAQWAEVRRRILAGEPARRVGADFGVSESAIRQKLGASSAITAQSAQVQETARKLAEARVALEALPPANRPAAQTLADHLTSISMSVAAGAELGAKTMHRLHALANSEVSKVDDADPLSPESIAALKNVGILTKLGNDSAHVALNLLAANKDAAKRLAEEAEPEVPGLPVAALSTETLAEIMRARDAGAK